MGNGKERTIGDKMKDTKEKIINLPLDSAATIYNYIYVGYPVICYYC